MEDDTVRIFNQWFDNMMSFGGSMGQVKKLFIKLLNLTKDVIFKAFFTKYESSLISFLHAVLPFSHGTQIMKVLSWNPEVFSDNPSKKKVFQLDLRLALTVKLKEKETPEKKLANVEMQTTGHKHFVSRTLAYICRIFSDQLGRGDDYKELSQVYSLVITTSNLKELEGTSDYYHVFNIRRTTKPYLLLSEDVVFVVIELGKFSKKWEETVDMKDKWCYLLKHSGNLPIEVYEDLKAKGGEMGEALENLEFLSKDAFLKEYEMTKKREEMDLKAVKETMYEEGMEKGIEKGMEKGQEKIISQLLKANMSVEQICQITALPQQEVLKIQSKIKS